MKNTLKKIIKPFFYSFLKLSIELAVRSEKLVKLRNKLISYVPDVTHQYTTNTIDSPYLKAKVRSLHAFQIHLASCEILNLPFENLSNFATI